MKRFTVLLSTLLLMATATVLCAQGSSEETRSSDVSIDGNLHPIGGSPTHISTEIYKYDLAGLAANGEVESVTWTLNPNVWPMRIISEGRQCELRILSFESDTVYLKVTVNINNGKEIMDSIPIVCVGYGYGVGENHATLSVEIAPNPTTGDVVLHLDNMQGNVGVSVFDMRGVQVDAFDLNATASRTETAYSLQGKPAGMYVFIMRYGNRVMTQKVLVN